MASIQQTILAKKAALADVVGEPLASLAQRCAAVWPDADALDRCLQEAIASIPNCHLVYAWDVDGMDVLAVAESSRTAVEAIRAGGGPHFLELRTYRFRAHSMFDPELYRDRGEVEEWKNRDPIEALKRTLEADGMLSNDDWAAIEDTVARVVDDAVAFAEAGTLEAVEELTRFVHSEEVTA